MSNFPLPYSSLPKRKAPFRARKKPQTRISKSGKIRLSGQALIELREQRYELDGGRCQWRKGKPDACGIWLPLYGSVFNRAHLAHVIPRSIGGPDTLENTRILCPNHHLVDEHTKGLTG